MTTDLFPYNGSAGHVERPASVQRAERERDSGALSERAATVLMELLQRGKHGATWQELSTDLDLHHGQISGCLSVMHKAGRVFSTKAQRDRCHVYVHDFYRPAFNADERFDEPVKTRSAARKDALEKVLAAAALVCQFDGTDRMSIEALRDAVWEVQSL
jgi:hypothetical protein